MESESERKKIFFVSWFVYLIKREKFLQTQQRPLKDVKQEEREMKSGEKREEEVHVKEQENSTIRWKSARTMLTEWKSKRTQMFTARKLIEEHFSSRAIFCFFLMHLITCQLLCHNLPAAEKNKYLDN